MVGILIHLAVLPWICNQRHALWQKSKKLGLDQGHKCYLIIHLLHNQMNLVCRKAQKWIAYRENLDLGWLSWQLWFQNQKYEPRMLANETSFYCQMLWTVTVLVSFIGILSE